MERESFVDFLRRLEKAFSSMKEAFEEIYEIICADEEDPPEEIDDPYYVEPHHTSDFLCIRLDLVPWYTSGFQ